MRKDEFEKGIGEEQEEVKCGTLKETGRRKT
jgi:hypothetical protein